MSRKEGRSQRERKGKEEVKENKERGYKETRKREMKE